MITSVEQLQELMDQIDEDKGDIVHYVCWCQKDAVPRYALCGYSMENQQLGTPTERDQHCLVCEELDQKPCERCGGL